MTSGEGAKLINVSIVPPVRPFGAFALGLVTSFIFSTECSLNIVFFP